MTLQVKTLPFRDKPERTMYATMFGEANELLERLPDIRKKKLPMFTSCCPGWVSFVKSEFPELAGCLSTTKSPQQIYGALIKTYFAQKIGVEPENIVSISVMPCVSKTGEATLEGMGNDVDYVLTTRELVRLLRSERIDPMQLSDVPFDSPIGAGTGAGVIFGATGGVMEAALRTAHFKLTGEEAAPDAFKIVRADTKNYPDATTNNGIVDGEVFTGKKKVAEFSMGDAIVRTCTVSGLGNTRKLLENIIAGREEYDFVEVMACPGGCVAGGGQPIHDNEEWGQKRSAKLYALDGMRTLRRSHENPDVIKVYEEFLAKPLSEKVEELRHIHNK